MGWPKSNDNINPKFLVFKFSPFSKGKPPGPLNPQRKKVWNTYCRYCYFLKLPYMGGFPKCKIQSNKAFSGSIYRIRVVSHYKGYLWPGLMG